jgi:hypothetical protein
LPDKPNDRPDSQAVPPTEVDPKIYVMVNGEKFPRPALATMFVDSTVTPDSETKVTGGCTCNPVVYCSCNKVGSTVASKPSCSCVGHSSSSGGGGGYGCRCAPVH